MNLVKLHKWGLYNSEAIELPELKWKKLKKWMEKAENYRDDEELPYFDRVCISMYTDGSCSVNVDMWPQTSGEKDVLLLSVDKLVF